MFDEREVHLENFLEVKAWDAEKKVVENFDAMIGIAVFWAIANELLTPIWLPRWKDGGACFVCDCWCWCGCHHCDGCRRQECGAVCCWVPQWMVEVEL